MADLLNRQEAEAEVTRRERELADFKFAVAKLTKHTVICKACGVIKEKRDVSRDRCWCDYESGEINY